MENGRASPGGGTRLVACLDFKSSGPREEGGGFDSLPPPPGLLLPVQGTAIGCAYRGVRFNGRKCHIPRQTSLEKVLHDVSDFINEALLYEEPPESIAFSSTPLRR